MTSNGDMAYLRPQFDPSNFDLTPYARLVDKPWGWELHFTPAHLPYMGKILHINAGSRISLQVHEEKLESWTLLSGRAKVVWENEAGALIETELEVSSGYTCAPGQQHRLVGITECEVVEVSTPERGTTWRLDDDYARPHETDAQRAIERGDA